VLWFEGMIRGHEGGRTIAGLQYQTYDPMAENQLHSLGKMAIEQFGVLGVVVEHSRGFVGAEACSFRLRIASRHRKEGLAAMDWFLDQMKRDVPIWKSPVFAEDRRNQGEPDGRPPTSGIRFT
jgi:molybdopterin synthase catalytic subunit